MFDFIMVGLGLAGWSFVRQLIENRKTFIVFDTGCGNSSLASAGVYNPVILKRFTLAWKASEWLPFALLQYRKFELETGVKIVYELPIYRKLTSVAEQNEWISISGRPGFKTFMNGISQEDLPGIEAPFGFGVMKNTGLIDMEKLLKLTRESLKKRNLLVEENFDYKALKHLDNSVQYKNIRARRIVFTEGFGLKKNPFFNYLPMTGTKGESLVVKLDIPIGVIVKSNVFLAPVPGSDLFLVGSTYNWEDKSLNPTPEARKHLTEKFEQLYSSDYKIMGQRVGIRPTVKDRRPLLGTHPYFKNMYILNGMGTRGVILAPMSARILFENILFDMEIPAEMDIMRFGFSGHS